LTHYHIGTLAHWLIGTLSTWGVHDAISITYREWAEVESMDTR